MPGKGIADFVSSVYSIIRLSVRVPVPNPPSSSEKSSLYTDLIPLPETPTLESTSLIASTRFSLFFVRSFSSSPTSGCFLGTLGGTMSESAKVKSFGSDLNMTSLSFFRSTRMSSSGLSVSSSGISNLLSCPIR